MHRTCETIRREFIEFFEQHGHTFVPSSSLLPAEDPTLLFANAGMNQFKDIFLGREQRDYTRAANSQKCLRAGGKHNDLEDVGHDTYHHTFFEMLGNWSFGDYFKREAIGWAWELLTDVWGLEPERLHVTVFGGDKSDGLDADAEAEAIWRDEIGVDPARIHHGDRKDNFWEMGDTGPCGPCSEIHYDQTPDGSGGGLVNADDPRVIEVWNLVFIQFNRAADGKLTPLPARHVDTGMGLERIGRILQGKRSNYATDLFVPIIEKIETLTDHRYGAASDAEDRFDSQDLDDIGDVACRVIADHARTLTFALADGILPSNEGRGYVLRRILRRASRYGRQYLDIEGAFLVDLAPTVVELMGEAFPEIPERQDAIIQTIREEEEAFGKTLDNGIKTWWSHALYALWDTFCHADKNKNNDLWFYPRTQPTFAPPEEDFFRQARLLPASPDTQIEIRKGKPNGSVQESFQLGDLSPALIAKYWGTPPEISGEAAFELYATYGFPVDLTQLMARERGMEVDMAGFDHAMAEHRELSGGGEQFKVAAVAGLPATDDSAKYSREPLDAKVLGWVAGDRYVTEGALEPGDEAAVVLDRTNFYGEQGGQVGDAGALSFDGGRFAVRDTAVAGQCVLHLGVLESGTLRPGQVVSASVDASRFDTMRNHTATHLLNWALREVLGEEVNQAGSVVAPDRLRFDFSHNQAVADEQLRKIETLVNSRVLADEPVRVRPMPLAEARKISGVRAVFGEKYPDPVRVVSVGVDDPLLEADETTPVEFCGGTHLDRTSQIGLFKITGEESVAKGVRRITAVTGSGAVERVRQTDDVLRSVSQTLRVPPEQIPERVEAMQKEIKELRKKPAGGGVGGGFTPVETLDLPAGKVVIGTSGDADSSTMRNLCDQQRQKGAAAVMVGAAGDGKVTLVAMVSEELVGASSFKAGDWVKSAAKAVGGGGGGKPTLAQAGGKRPEKLPDALKTAAEFAAERLG